MFVVNCWLVVIVCVIIGRLSDCDLLNASLSPLKPSPIDVPLTVAYASIQRIKFAVICDSLCCQNYGLVPFTVCFLYTSGYVVTG